MRGVLQVLRDDPCWPLVRLWGKILAAILRRMRNVSVGKGLIVLGRPLIDIRGGSRLEMGAEVTLSSRNRGYHVNMHAPVKLFADRPGAVIRIGAQSRLNGCCLHACESIEVGARCLLAANVQIFDGSGHSLSFPDVEQRIYSQGESRPVVLEDDVWIGANAIVLPGVRIGRGSVIAAGSVVSRSIPPMVVAGGNPARILRDYSSLEEWPVAASAELLSAGQKML